MTQHCRNYSAPDAARLARVTYRQLDHAIRLGLLRPGDGLCGSGHPRRLDLQDVLRLRAAKILSDELNVGIPRALEMIPADADLEGLIEIHPSKRLCMQVNLQLNPDEWWDLEMAA